VNETWNSMHDKKKKDKKYEKNLKKTKI